MIANHFSWWDGFIQILLNDRLFKKRYHFMMLEEELDKNRILRRIGASSIQKGSRSALESLQYMLEVVQSPENLFLFFPQGEIQSIYTHQFQFEKGALNYILKKSTRNFQFTFNVNLIDYGSFKRPELSVYFKNFELTETTTAEEIENSYNAFAQECMAKQREQ